MLSTCVMIALVVAFLWPKRIYGEVHQVWPPKISLVEWEPLLLPLLFAQLKELLAKKPEPPKPTGDAVPVSPPSEEKVD